MLFRLVRPMRRKDTSIPHFVQRIPSDLIPKVSGLKLSLPVGDKIVARTVSASASVVKVSLGTRDPHEAKIRQAQIATYLEGVWQSIRKGPAKLTMKQAVALAGEIYRTWVGALEDDPGSPSLWGKVKADNETALRGEFGYAQLMIPGHSKTRKSLEERFGGFADVVLSKRGLVIDQESREKLLGQVAAALGLAAEKLQRHSFGDYTPDNNEARFPEWTASKPVEKSPSPSVTINQLLQGWWKEAGRDGGRSKSTFESYSKAVRYFIDYLGHEDATKVTARDVVGYKDKRLEDISPKTGKPISARTINDSELSGLKTVFGWGVKQHLIPDNPAKGIAVSYTRPVIARSKGFTDEEAVALLRHALNHRRVNNETEKIANAKRWVPWVCAYTGARVGEIVQMRKQDLIKRGGCWFIVITPDAFAVKGRQYRHIPIHPHLVETGFVVFVQSQTDGYLFLSPNAQGEVSGAWNAAKNRLQEFARQIITDLNVKPNHGWRHRFITLGRRHGMSQEIRRMITGHRGEGIDEQDYGDPEGLYREICKLPAYKV